MAKQIKTCRTCGATPLIWGTSEGRYVLVDPVTGAKHVCGNGKGNGGIPPGYNEFGGTEEGSMNREELIEKAVGMGLSRQEALNMRIAALQAWLTDRESLQGVREETPKPKQDAPAPQNGNGAASDAGKALFDLIAPHIRQQFGNGDIKKLVEDAVEALMPNVREVSIQVKDAPKVKVGRVHKCFEDLLQLTAITDEEGFHDAIVMVGPAGSFKTSSAKKVAESLGLNYYPVSVGPQSSKTDFFGFVDAHGKPVWTVFKEAYAKGGVFLLDEMDAGNAGVLVVLNAALANGECSFPDGVVTRHPDFVCLAAMNTWGQGADREYVGRLPIDAATLDRFTFLAWPVDEDLEMDLFGKPYGTVGVEWVKYVQRVRKATEKAGVRFVVSPRASKFGALQLHNGVRRQLVEQVRLWKGIKADDKAKIMANM